MKSKGNQPRKPRGVWRVTVNPALGEDPLPPAMQEKLDKANETLTRVGLPKPATLQSGLVKTMIDPELEEKLGNRVLFPEKLARANEELRKHGLPKDFDSAE